MIEAETRYFASSPHAEHLRLCVLLRSQEQELHDWGAEYVHAWQRFRVVAPHRMQLPNQW